MTTSKTQWQAGALIQSRFRLVRRIGAGGMGEVYLAEDQRLGRKVALKLLKPRFTADEDSSRRFKQEACAASALNHPNIITIYDIAQEGLAHFIVAEFIEGTSLRQHMMGKKVSVLEALTVAIQVADALSAVHKINVVHRDIKPENIMLRSGSHVKILDFGLAKLTNAHLGGGDMDLVITRPGVILGTPGYMSPEQACGEQVDWRTDIFSLGVVLYEIITGHRPFEGKTVGEVIASTLSKDPLPVKWHAPEVPDELQEIISSALCKDRERRNPTAGELVKALRGLWHRLKDDNILETNVLDHYYLLQQKTTLI